MPAVVRSNVIHRFYATVCIEETLPSRGFDCATKKAMRARPATLCRLDMIRVEYSNPPSEGPTDAVFIYSPPLGLLGPISLAQAPYSVPFCLPRVTHNRLKRIISDHLRAQTENRGKRSQQEKRSRVTEVHINRQLYCYIVI